MAALSPGRFSWLAWPIHIITRTIHNHTNEDPVDG
jgi:hypothetical protein